MGPVARRYARALLDVARSTPGDEPDAPSRLRTALAEGGRLLESQGELMAALTHPTAAVEARKKVASAVWAKAPATFIRLLHILIERDRLRLLPQIAEAYAEAWNESRGVLAARAVSAVDLDSGQRAALADALEKATRKGVELESQVDPAVLGGLKVTLGGRTYDGTVKTQLVALKRTLRGTA